MALVTSSAVWTLLDIVNHILGMNEAEKVSSIGDTVEAEQVADIVKGTFYNIVSNKNWEGHRTTFSLSSFSDNEKPTHMRLPTSVKELTSLNYDCRDAGETTPVFKEMRYVEPSQFVSMTNKANTGTNVVAVTLENNVTLLIRNNKHPEYYTSFNDKDVIFDSYDSEADTVLRESKTQCVGFTHPHFEMEDDYVPDLPEDAMMYLIEDSKSTASIILRQSTDQKAEMRSMSQRRFLSRKSWRTNGDLITPDYGRRTASRTRSPYLPPKS